MDIKTELKNSIQERFNGTVSSVFMHRVYAVIDEASHDKDSLVTAADKVSKLVGLFIDKNVAKAVLEDLQAKIESTVEKH